MDRTDLTLGAILQMHTQDATLFCLSFRDTKYIDPGVYVLIAVWALNADEILILPIVGHCSWTFCMLHAKNLL